MTPPGPYFEPRNARCASGHQVRSKPNETQSSASTADMDCKVFLREGTLAFAYKGNFFERVFIFHVPICRVNMSLKLPWFSVSR